MRRPFLASLALAACAVDLSLPTAPSGPPPRPTIAGFAPTAAYTGTKVRITGNGFPPEADSIVVRFSSAATARPDAVAANGSWLEVRVPDGAFSGAIRITTPGGQADSAGSFTYLGPGRLRRGGITARASVKHHLEAVPLATAGTVGLIANGVGWVAQADGARVRSHDAAYVFGLAPLPDGSDFLFLGGLGADGPACEGTTLARFNDGQPVAVACLPHTVVEDAPDQLVIDPTSQRVLVTSWSRIWAVDRRTTPPAVRRWAGDGRSAWRSPSWVGGDRFVVGEGAALRAIDFTSGPADHLLLEAPDGAERAYTATRGTLLAASVEGRLHLLDTTTWPPTRVASLDMLGVFGPLAFSRDGTHVAVSDLPTGEVMAFVDVAARPLRQVGIARLPVPGAPASGPDATFYVGMNTGWAVLSLEGRLLGSWNVPADLSPPRLALDARRDSAGAPLLITHSRLFGTTFAFDPATLSPLGTLSTGRLHSLAGSVGKTALYAERNGRVERNDDAAQGAYTLPEGSWTGTPRIDLDDDGGLLLLRSSNDAGGQTIRLLDTSTVWTPDLQPPHVDLDEPVLASRLDAGRLVVVTTHQVRVLDATSSGPLPSVGPGDASDEPLVAAGISRALVVVLLEGTDGVPRVRLHDPTDGTRLADWPLPSGVGPISGLIPEVDGVIVSPGGLRAWWLADLGEGRQIASIAIDPQTLAVSALFPMPVSSAATELFGSPNGETLVVLDRTNDLLQLVQ